MAGTKRTGKLKASRLRKEAAAAAATTAAAAASTTTSTSSPATAAPAPAPASSPRAQPPALSAREKAALKRFLDATDNPFVVHLEPLTRKRKRGGTRLTPLTDLFQERLSVLHEVRPREKWERLRRFKRFTIGSETIAVGDCVLVKQGDDDGDGDGDANPTDALDVEAQWKAKVLDVRALDAEHVYLKVAWLNRPEDLEGGRKAYHGRHELIPTNQLDVIDAMAVNGVLDVTHWDDADEKAPLPDDEEYFWRQTYDVAFTRTFSQLRPFCIDAQPQNPDELILQCDRHACAKWQHARCLAAAAAQRETARLTDSSPSDTVTATPLSIPAGSPARAIVGTPHVTAALLVRGLPAAGTAVAACRAGTPVAPARTSEIRLTQRDDGTTTTCAIECLFCGGGIA